MLFFLVMMILMVIYDLGEKYMDTRPQKSYDAGYKAGFVDGVRQSVRDYASKNTAVEHYSGDTSTRAESDDSGR